MPTPALLTALDRRGVLVLDGALATELENRGADLSGGLWSARLLLERPELIAQVHRDYLAAGADVLITASYQASLAGFVRAGRTPAEARALMQHAVSLARQARDDWAAEATRADTRPHPLVATSVGPYGAVLADGSEYRGDYDISPADLVRFHRERLEVLVDGGVEVLACETLPSLAEAEALVEALSGWPEVTAWVSFSARNDREVSDGTPAARCAAFLHEQPQVLAVGVNCTAVSHITPLLQRLAGATDKPLLTYPNSGETYDADTHSWRGDRAESDFSLLAQEWHAAGARLVGGCCRTRPADIRAVAEGLRAAHPAPSSVRDGPDAR
jgi:homocysteine S-methyltransferase